jgi:hypothetical protein
LYREAELFSKRVDYVPLFDQAHLYQDFSDPFRARAASALDLARSHQVMLSHEAATGQNITEAQPAAIAAREFFKARPADPIHFEQHIAQSLFAVQLLLNLAGL